MKTATHEEMLNRFVGETGTPERIEFENELKAEILAYRVKQPYPQKNLLGVWLTKCCLIQV